MTEVMINNNYYHGTIYSYEKPSLQSALATTNSFLFYKGRGRSPNQHLTKPTVGSCVVQTRGRQNPNPSSRPLT